MISAIDGSSQINVQDVRSVPQLPVNFSSMADSKNVDEFPHLKNVQLPYIENEHVDMLIGSGCTQAFIVEDQAVGAPGEPYAAKYPLGWTIIGPSKRSSNDPATVNLQHEITNEQLSLQIQAMWDHDCRDLASSKTSMSIAEKSITKVNGRYQVKIPFKTNPKLIPNNKQVAAKRLTYLKHKFIRQPDLKANYTKTMNGYLKDGYLREVTDSQLQEEGSHGVWYVPHHAVTHPKKPGKVRVVFDCLAQFQGKSLNDHTYMGPDLVNSLLGILIRFREKPVAVMGDIEMMYLRTQVYPKDQKFLRILWFPGGDIRVTQRVYCMTSNLFGAGFSGFNANFALRRCADDGIGRYDPDVIRSVHENFYVDDFIMSVNDNATAIKYIKQLRCLLSEGGLRLHKWMSNSRDVLQSVSESERAGSVKELDKSTNLPTDRTLGVNWNADKDAFTFNVELQRKAVDLPVTKRTILSTAASLFDPLGFLAPILLILKLLMQNLFREKLDWDDPAPETLKNQWYQWLDELPHISSIFIDRCLQPESYFTAPTIELHYFCDASESAYGAVCWEILRQSDGNSKISFIMGKARVAPLKLVTIPRLELCGAVLAARLHETIFGQMRSKVSKTYFWCDSMTVLRYIRKTTSRFKTYVANRISIIQDLTRVRDWRRIDGSLNPADLASRGFMPSEREKLKLWHNGPEFLKTGQYPEKNTEAETVDTDEECTAMLKKAPSTFLDDAITRCGTWKNLLRVIMICLQYAASNLKRRNQE